MYLIRKTIALQQENKVLYQKLLANCSPEEKHKTHLDIAIKHFNLQEYSDFWTNIATAEKYAQKYALKEELPIKLFKLAAALKTNQQQKTERLKKELHLHSFDNNLLAKINFKIDNYNELLPAFEKFLADIYLAHTNRDESYYQELNSSEKKYDEHLDEVDSLMGRVYLEKEIEKEVLILCSTAVIQTAKKDQQYSDFSNINLIFADILAGLFLEKLEKVDSLVVFYHEKGLSNISKEQINKTLRRRAALIARYDQINNSNDLEKIIEHGRILMRSNWTADYSLNTLKILNKKDGLDDRINTDHLIALLGASNIFLRVWNQDKKNKLISKKEIDEIVVFIEKNLRVLLNSHFIEHEIPFNGNQNISVMYNLFRKDIKETNRSYVHYIDTYAEVLIRNKIIK